MEPLDQIAANLLIAALIAAQKVEKKFRQLKNRNEISDVQLRAVKQIVEDYRALCDVFGVQRVDIDRHQRGRRLGREEKE